MSKLGCEYCSGENDKSGWRGGFSDDGFIGYTACCDCNSEGEETIPSPTPIQTPQSTFDEKLQEALYKFAPDITDVQHIKLMAAITSLVLEENQQAIDNFKGILKMSDTYTFEDGTKFVRQRSIITKEKDNG